jgi:Bacterial PH domain
MKVFKASLDSAAVIITTGITLLFLFILYLLVLNWNNTGYGKYFSIAFLPLIYLIAWLLRPVNYRITNDELIVYRLLRSVHIPLKNIRRSEKIDSNQISWSLRTFGVGGLFGYYGRFRNQALGAMIWYATRKDKPVMIQTIHDEKIILTPDDPAQFLEVINRLKGGSESDFSRQR